MESQIMKRPDVSLRRGVKPAVFFGLLFVSLACFAENPAVEAGVKSGLIRVKYNKIKVDEFQELQARAIKLQAAVDRLESAVYKIGQIADWQSAILKMQAKDRSTSAKRDACFKQCEETAPYPKYDDKSAAADEQRSRAEACFEPCRQMPMAPGSAGC
jgi:hypothetical protein